VAPGGDFRIEANGLLGELDVVGLRVCRIEGKHPERARGVISRNQESGEGEEDQ
jgi:hypothetical protein